MKEKSRPTDLSSVIADHRVVVCVGSGGVGKTTTAASLALWGALSGRQTAVVTIDPAKRLADCFGIDPTNAQGKPVPSETFRAYGLNPSGTLTALLIDQPSAWDAAIARYAPTIEIRERILANRFYQGLSRTFAGSHEYIALDTLASLVQQGTYDLIVVDTPPARQALDFLEAPQRLQRFLDSRARKWFVRPAGGWSIFSAMNKTTAFLLRKIEEATGISALAEISDFFTTMQGMFDDFGERFQRVSALLASEETAFVLVSTLEEEVLTEATQFLTDLDRLTIALKAVIFNRTHADVDARIAEEQIGSALVEQLSRAVTSTATDTQAQEWLVKNFLAHQTLAQGETIRFTQFAEQLSSTTPLIRVPVFPEFPGDFRGLINLASHLFPTTAPPKPRRKHKDK
ncbi:MAG: ArsA family ATPase [Deltaproteobacteria bacterium]|nr:ArsA family ATPase [Deltaproteobacteria bacterium]